MSTQKPRVDEEDDLDDLDDVLDQFSVPPSQPVPPVTSSTSSEPTRSAMDPPSGEFVAELAKGMQSLFEELGLDPESAGTNADVGAGGDDASRKLAAAWEAMLVEGMNASSDPSASASASTPKPKHDFQSQIRSTLDKLKESESKQLQPEQGSDMDELLDGMLRSTMGEGELELQGILESMMGQLMSKEVLYEPLKELNDKFPGYLAEHASTISPEDRTRYEAQISCIKRLINEFEASSFSDEDENSRKQIVDLMGELQTHGQPPEEIMGPLPPGFGMGADGLPEVPENCNIN